MIGAEPMFPACATLPTMSEAVSVEAQIIKSHIDSWLSGHATEGPVSVSVGALASAPAFVVSEVLGLLKRDWSSATFDPETLLVHLEP